MNSLPLASDFLSVPRPPDCDVSATSVAYSYHQQQQQQPGSADVAERQGISVLSVGDNASREATEHRYDEVNALRLRVQELESMLEQRQCRLLSETNDNEGHSEVQDGATSSAVIPDEKCDLTHRLQRCADCPPRRRSTAHVVSTADVSIARKALTAANKIGKTNPPLGRIVLCFTDIQVLSIIA